jgi:hypothetical protein
MTNSQKIWSEEAFMKYPKQWIVFTEMEYDPQTYKHMGVVHYVTPDKCEAYEVARTLGRSRGNTGVMEGFNDTPHIGGLWSCTQ